MKARTDHHAARSSRPGEWCFEDLEAARLEANETGRPWGSHGDTPDDVWQERRRVTDDERRALKESVGKFKHWWRIHVVGDKPRKEITQAEDDEIMRNAIASALKTLGYLKAGRRRNYSTTSSQKSGKHI